MIKLSSIKPNPANPRILKDSNFDKLCKSIETFAEKMMPLRPIIIDENSIILGGNMRYKALKHLGYKEVPNDWIKQAKDLTEDEKKEFIVRDNVGFGEWDFEMFETEDWEKDLVEEWGVEFPSFEDEAETKLEAKEDDYQEPDNLKVDVVMGDLIEIGVHRLLCGDSTDSDAVGKVMGSDKIDLYITDPPYGVSYADKNKFLNAVAFGNRIETEIINDHLSVDDSAALWYDTFTTILPFASGKMSYYIFSAQGGELMMMMMMIDKVFQLKHSLIWVKNNHVLGRCDYSYKHEPILYGWTKNGTHEFYGGFQTSTLEFPKPLKNDLHPTMKPIELLSRLIENSSIVGQLILDSFLGSGSTMVAAHQLNRKCYGLELSEKYCQVIIDRMTKLDPNLKIKINGLPYEPKTEKLPF